MKKKWKRKKRSSEIFDRDNFRYEFHVRILRERKKRCAFLGSTLNRLVAAHKRGPIYDSVLAKDRQRKARSVNVVEKRVGDFTIVNGHGRSDRCVLTGTIVTDTKPETSSDTRWELESRMRFFSRVKARRLPSARFCDTSTSPNPLWSSLDRSSITRISALGGSMESG